MDDGGTEGVPRGVLSIKPGVGVCLQFLQAVSNGLPAAEEPGRTLSDERNSEC